MSISIIGSSIQRLRQKFSQSTGLPIREALPETEIEAELKAEGIAYRRCLFDPIVTIWAFLCQVLDSDRSCRKAISRVFAYLCDSQDVSDPMERMDSQSDTGAYCKARQRVFLDVVKRLYRRVATHLEAGATPERQWLGRRVFLVDGTTVLMPDTEENQAAYPQHPNQKAGCGFPLAKLVTVFSLTTGALIFCVTQKGFRSRTITVVTTLLDPIAYPKDEIARLYGLRWEVEIDLRHLKSSMEMDFLRTKTPAMIHKELAMYFLAYNLIRSLMSQAALRYGKDPIRLSFKGTLQHLNTFLPLLATSGPNKRRQHYQMLLLLIAGEQLPDRPGRVEPRMVKRRPKCSRWLQEPRAVLKRKLVA